MPLIEYPFCISPVWRLIYLSRSINRVLIVTRFFRLWNCIIFRFSDFHEVIYLERGREQPPHYALLGMRNLGFWCPSAHLSFVLDFRVALGHQDLPVSLVSLDQWWVWNECVSPFHGAPPLWGVVGVFVLLGHNHLARNDNPWGPVLWIIPKFYVSKPQYFNPGTWALWKVEIHRFVQFNNFIDKHKIWDTQIKKPRVMLFDIFSLSQ